MNDNGRKKRLLGRNGLWAAGWMMVAALLLVGAGCVSDNPPANNGDTTNPPVQNGDNGQQNNDNPSQNPQETQETVSDKGNVVITEPDPNELVTNPIHLQGRARVFENTAQWRLKDSAGKVLMEGTTMADAPDVGQFGDIDVWIPVPAVTNENLTVELFYHSAKDGSEQEVVSVPVKLGNTTQQNIQLYFGGDASLDPEQTCTETFPVDRSVAGTESPARVAALLLLQGPNEAEKEDGHQLTIPNFTTLNDINLRSDGTLVIDLGGGIAGNVAGSCAVQAITSQIEDTMKQFESVEDVVILINGQEEQLQP